MAIHSARHLGPLVHEKLVQEGRKREREPPQTPFRHTMRILVGLVLLAPLLAAGSVGPQPAHTRLSALVSALRGGSSSGSGLRVREEEAAGGWLDLSASENSAEAAGWNPLEPPLTVAGTLDDPACWSGAEGVAGEQNESGPSPVSVRYYDLTEGVIFNLTQTMPGSPNLSGLWQLTVGLRGREWTFDAHRGIWSFPEHDSPYGDPMAVVQQERSFCQRGTRSYLLRFVAGGTRTGPGS